MNQKCLADVTRGDFVGGSEGMMHRVISCYISQSSLPDPMLLFRCGLLDALSHGSHSKQLHMRRGALQSWPRVKEELPGRFRRIAKWAQPLRWACRIARLTARIET